MKKDYKDLLLLCLLGFIMGQVSLLGTSLAGLGFYFAGIAYTEFVIPMAICTLMGNFLKFDTKECFLNLVIISMVTFMAMVLKRRGIKKAYRLDDVKLYGIFGSGLYIAVSLAKRKNELYGIFEAQTDYFTGAMEVTKIAAYGVILTGLSVIFSYGISYLVNGRRHRKPDFVELLSTVTLMFVLIKSINITPDNVFSIELTLIFFLIMVGGYINGSGAGALIGAIGAIIYNLENVNVDFEKTLVLIGIFTLLGGVSAAFSRINMIFGVGGLLSLLVCFYFVMKRNVNLAYMFPKEVIGAGITGGILFVIAGVFINKNKEEIMQQEAVKSKDNFTAKRLDSYSKAFDRLCESFPRGDEKKNILARRDVENVFRLLSENVCVGCEKISSCWEGNYYATYADTLDIIDNAWKNGKVEKNEIGIGFCDKCTCFDKFVMQVEMAVDVARINMRWINKILETRQIFKNQFKEVAEVFEGVSKDMENPDYFSDAQKQSLRDNLENAGLVVKEIFATNKGYDRIKLNIQCKAKKEVYVTTRQVAMAINNALGREFNVSEIEKISIGKELMCYSFYETPVYKVMTGVARVAKSGEQDSGDNYSFSNMDNGEVVMLLCDGMGSGTSAGMESKKVVELIENLMEAGFSWRSAVSFINCIYAWGEDGKDLYTLDMGLINLYTGACSFIKEGAFATFIRRKNWVESISSVSLPGGIFVKTQMDVVEKKLYNGDFVIMASDGVSQCLPKGEEVETMEKIISGLPATNPSVMASKIIEKCVEYNNYIADDDMTVLVLSIWNR